MLRDLTFGDEEVLLDDIPAAPAHDGGRIAFGPDGHLYVAAGDALEPETAADEESLAGKILRIDVDGDIPEDNPADASPVYSFGHRNVQGLAWDDDGNLYASEHGPTGEFDLCCNDELNLIEAGGFYGWPFTMGEVGGADGEPPADTIEPVANSGDGTWAPGRHRRASRGRGHRGLHGQPRLGGPAALRRRRRPGRHRQHRRRPSSSTARVGCGPR